MRIVTATFESLRDLLHAYEDHRHGGALFYATRMELVTGERVLLELTIPGLPSRLLLRAVVAEVPGPQPGAWFRIAEEDEPTRDFVLAVARGDLEIRAKLPRRHIRFPVTLPVSWKVSGSPDEFYSTSADIGTGGMFVRTLTPPPIGTDVQMRIGPTRAGDLAVDARVAWVRDSGELGMGVRFANPQDDSTKRLRELLRWSSERGRMVLGPGPRAEA